MDIASLSQLPPPLPSKAEGSRSDRNWRLTRQTARIFVGLLWLVGFAILLLWLRDATDSFRKPHEPQSKPFPFDRVKQRVSRLRLLQPKAEVIALLGPESNAPFWEPEIEGYDRLVDTHPDRFPGERTWAKWSDPADPTRWIAILFCNGVTYHVIKQNLQPPSPDR